jgi:hypothetical protein
MEGVMAGNANRRLFEKAWKKAMAEGKVELRFSNRLVAFKARWGLYSVKESQCGEDFELLEARRNCSIGWVNETTLVVYRIETGQLFAEMTEALGGEADTMTATEKELQEMQERMFAQFEAERKARAETPAAPASVLDVAKNKFGAR